MKPRISWLRSMWQVLRQPDQVDADMRDEMRFHIEMETDRLIAQGMDRREATRQAHVRFGGVQKYRDAGRQVRGLRWLDAIAADVRIAVRMLARHRGLTFAGGFAMAVTIGIGASGFEFLSEVLRAELPFDDGDRIVAVRYATSTPGGAERRVVHEFSEWRDQLVSIEHLTAYRTVERNLVTPGVTPEPVIVAEMSAAGFAVLRTPPLLGRYLLPGDEVEGAPSVAVIGHRGWQTRFGGDRDIVGRTINLGGDLTTIVGVMPEGFSFPTDHEVWIPLRENPARYERLQGPSLHLFGRLAPGSSLEQAQAELTSIGERAAAARPATHAGLRPVALPFAHEQFGITDPIREWMVRLAALLAGALALVVAVNLAILIYARTATRLGELAVRTALGASRRRILVQLFIEALALTSVGALAGLALARIAIAQSVALIEGSGGRLAFWIDLALSPATVIYSFALAAATALIVGVLPGLRATGSRVQASLHELHGRTGTRLGAVWTTLVVAQITVAVAVMPVAVYVSWQVVQMELAQTGFAAEQFVVGTMALRDEESAVDSARMRDRQVDLMARLAAEPGVAAVTFSSAVPGFPAGGGEIEFEESSVNRRGGTPWVSIHDVGLSMFAAYDTEMLSGRVLTTSDLGDASAVLVNQTFVRRYLSAVSGRDRTSEIDMVDNRRALGVRFRYGRAQRLAAWPRLQTYEIVGVVRDFPSFPMTPGSEGEPTIYHAAAPGDVHPAVISVRFNGPIPGGVTERMRRLGADVDPAMQLRDVVPLRSFYDEARSFWRSVAWAVGLLTASVVLLSAAGIYAMLAFAVAQRTREIGIRVALGAHPRRLFFSIFGRVTRQIGIGLVAGSILSGAVFFNTGMGPGGATVLVLAVAGLMTGVGLVAALGPARRVLRIPAIEALRVE